MRGCETCSGLVYVGDAFCATCGAEVEKVRAGTGKVTIPVRRHGVAPPPPRQAAAVPQREDRQLSTALVVLFSLVSAGWVGVALYWLL